MLSKTLSTRDWRPSSCWKKKGVSFSRPFSGREKESELIQLNISTLSLYHNWRLGKERGINITLQPPWATPFAPSSATHWPQGTKNFPSCRKQRSLTTNISAFPAYPRRLESGDSTSLSPAIPLQKRLEKVFVQAQQDGKSSLKTYFHPFSFSAYPGCCSGIPLC